MRIWLITIGEPLPIDSAHERLLRTGIVAEMLAARGHEVVWWSSAFNHMLKTFRALDNRSVDVRVGLRIQLLFGGGYKRNISFARLSDHQRLAREFTEMAAAEPRPDVILCSLPPLELSVAAVDYGARHHVPVVLDVRDLWPDVFLGVVPRVLQPLGHAALRRMRETARRACAGASVIWGHAPGFVEWGLAHAGRPAGIYDSSFAFGYADAMPSEADRARAASTWDALGVHAHSNELVACFTGTIGRQFDIQTVLDAAERLRGTDGLRFVFCGIGDRLEVFKKRARRLPNVLFAGWRDRAELWTLLRRASVGIAPYVDRPDFVATVPNKAAEYWSGGLPIALSLDKGILKALLDDNQCGFSYGGDSAALAAGLLSLRNDPSLLRLQSNNALDLFNRQFRADVVYGGMITVLEQIAAAGR